MNELPKDTDSKQIKKLKKALAKALVLSKKQHKIVESLQQLIIKTEDAQAPLTSHQILRSFKHRKFLCVEVSKTGVYVFANDGLCQDEKESDYVTKTLQELDHECCVTNGRPKTLNFRIPIESLIEGLS